MTRRLPRTLEHLRGLRAARWIRESTAGQADNFGPDAQREQQDRALERWGLVDVGLAWQVAHSGKTVATTAQWAEMRAAAGRDYDVLLVGYVSRFARNAKLAFNIRDELHAAGAVVVFCDERILTSDEDAWEHWAREAVEAEAYSRRLGKRIREGYAAKRRRHADPGGRAPFGFRRETEKPHRLTVDQSRVSLVGRVFELAAARLTDREVAGETGLGLYTVRGMLTNPLYAGRLRDGTSTRENIPPIIPDELFDRVQATRELRRSRDRRPARRRTYALSMLRCSGCGRRLIGDTGRYRHVDACPAFVAAARIPARRRRGQHVARAGQSYPADAYEELVGKVLRHVELGAGLLAEVMTDDVEYSAPDRLALARIERDRAAALERYRRTRDTAELEATMARLDGLEDAARSAPGADPLSPAERLEYLRNLPALWADARETKRLIAESLFERIEVLGLRRIHLEPTASATRWGLAEAFHVRSAGYGRGERSRARDNRLILGIAGERVVATMGGVRLPPLRALRTA